ncbi:hypothetical protein L6164_017464 [Bauhinia variegata]|uniref:Uncharacterized protein n=1 Tax=Bauhinia variegata TaxID=167791 RepID=A0ACB9N974_BAUVA|nr:hypothetical protein L6164_017464 [Bauhinia variegata]
MDFKGRHNNADGKVPEFGAIFMSNTATKRECFQRRLFGLPSALSRFVKQVKAGMILFLFEHEKRQLHGVFEASCDGGIDIVPHAFSSLGKHFPAQVRFIPIWYCKPLPESIFCDAIKENYFSANKFNFGLSENQVRRLLDLFSLRKIELEHPVRQLTSVKPERVGRPSYCGIQVRDVENDRDEGGNNLQSISHKYNRQYVQYDGEPNDIGLNGSDLVRKRQRCDAKHGVDTTSGNSGDYLSLKNERRFIKHNKEYPHKDVNVRTNMSGGCPRSPSAKVEAYDDDRFPKGDKLTCENMEKRDQRMVCSDNSGFNQSEVVSSVFRSKPILETDSFVQNEFRPMPHPIQSGISSFSCPSAPDSNFRRSPSVRMYDNCDSMQMSAPSNNYWRSNIRSLNNQPPHMELEDINRCHDDSYITAKEVPFGTLGHHKFSSAGYRIPSDVAQDSEMLKAEPIACEELTNFHFLKSSSVPLPSSDVIRNSGRRPELFPLMFDKYNSPLCNDVQPLEFEENIGHKSRSPVVSRAIQMHYGDPSISEYDIEYCGHIQHPNFGFPKKKLSVFSRLSYTQDIHKQENGNNTPHGKYDGYPSLDEIMEAACHNQWIKKGKLEPLVEHDDAEILRDKGQIVSLKGNNMDISATNEETTDQIAEQVPFVDFKRRSQVKKINSDQTKRGSEESEKSEDLVLLKKKRRKLIRPNFSESKTSDGMGPNNVTTQNLLESPSQESSVRKDACESCNAFVGNVDNIKTDIEPSHLIRQTHYEDKSGHAKECANGEEGTASNGGCISNVGIKYNSECPENSNQKALSSSSSEEKSQHIVEGLLCTKDNIKSASPNTQSLDLVGEMHHGDKNTCAVEGINFKGGTLDGGEVLTSEVKYGHDCLENFSNENALIPASCEPGFNTNESSRLKHLTMQHEPEPTDFSMVAKGRSENEKETSSISQHFREAAVGSRMLDSRSQSFKLMGVNICVVDGEGKEKN